MDAFFAAVEQRDNPAWRGKPLVVGSRGRRGVVAAASYEARKYGVRSAMPSVTAQRKCPHLIFAKARFDVYKAVSQQIRAIFHEYTDLVEPLSLDEAFLDVTEHKSDLSSATLIALAIQEKIKASTQLTASAGISVNKFIAKVATDMNKPNGITVIRPRRVERFIEELPIEKFFGVGKVTAEKMKKFGIHNGLDLKAWSKLDLIKLFGKQGRYYYQIARGIDHREVKPHRQRKSIGAERTFTDDISEPKEMWAEIVRITGILAGRISRTGSRGKTVTLKIKTHDFRAKSRSKTVDRFIDKETDVLDVLKQLFNDPHPPQEAVRLLGVYLSNLENSGLSKSAVQLEFPFETGYLEEEVVESD